MKLFFLILFLPVGALAQIPTISSTHTLTNKTMSGGSNTFLAIPATAITGTAATLTGTEALRNKSVNGVTLSGTGTLAHPTTGTLTFSGSNGGAITVGGTSTATSALSLSGTGVILDASGNPSIDAAARRLRNSNNDTPIDWSGSAVLFYGGAFSVDVDNGFIGLGSGLTGLTYASLSGTSFTLGSATQSVTLTASNGHIVTATAQTITPAVGNITGLGTGVATALGVNVGSAGAFLTGNQTVTISGDATGSGATAITLTLANTAVTSGTYGNATQVGQFVVDSKGRLTNGTNITLTPAVGSITGFGSGVATFLATPSSANLRAALTDENGTGVGLFDSATNPTFNGATIDNGSLIISGNISAAAWTTSGLRLKGISGTLTDTTSSGTVAAAYTNKLGGNTIAASNTTTFTHYTSAYFSEPVAGTNVTFTNKWALGADSLRVGTSNPLTISLGGVLTATNPTLTGGTFTSGTFTSPVGVVTSVVAGGGLTSGTITTTGTLSVSTAARTGAVGITIDGNGSAITTGLKGYISVPYDCTIQSVTMLADQSGSCVIDIYKAAYASFPPTVSNSITASAKPTITSTTKSTDSTLTGWTTSSTAGDIWAFNVDSNTSITRLNITVKVLK